MFPCTSDETHSIGWTVIRSFSPRRFLPLFLLVMVVGCAETSGSKSTHTTVFTNDPLTADLAASADRTSKALDRLSAVETTRTPVPDPGPLNAIPPGLETPVTVEWTGPLAPLVSRIATMGGYRFRVTGKPPAVPVVVDIDATNEPLVEILRNAGQQGAARAGVVIDVRNRVIEVRYAP